MVYVIMLVGCLDMIKIMFYVGEVRMICSFVEGIIELVLVLLSLVDGGLLWDGLVWVFINYINNCNEKMK